MIQNDARNNQTALNLRRSEIGDEDGVVEAWVSEANGFVCGWWPAHLGCGVGDALKRSNGRSCCGVGNGGKCDG